MSLDANALNHLKILWSGLESRVLELEKKQAEGKRLTKVEVLSLREAKYLVARFPNLTSKDPFMPGEPTSEEIEAGKKKFKKGLDRLTKSELIDKLSHTLFELNWERKTAEYEESAYDFLFQNYEDTTKKIISKSNNIKQGKASEGTYHGNRKKLARQVVGELSDEGSLSFDRFRARMRKHAEHLNTKFSDSTLREWYRSLTGHKSTISRKT